MEVEYKDVDDPAIYVAFKIVKNKSEIKMDLSDAYLLVWTTTPWTLPSNVSIAVNPKEVYVAVKTIDKTFIIAQKRLETVAGVLDQSFTVLGEFTGSQMEGIYYKSPLEERIEKQKEMRRFHRIILSDALVTMEDGSGLVHIAPGNGVEDYALGVANKLPIFSPVGPDAAYTAEAGFFSGLKIPFDANKAVLNELELNGSLINKGTVHHSYPHCWRCANKLIFLATKQWFLKVGKIKKKLLAANDRIRWHPEQVKGWQRSILENSPDWCISRQRYWGIPMPVWRCKECSEISVVGSAAELNSRAKNREYAERLTDFHRPYIDRVILKCPRCGGDQERVKDILDVWFDSSIAFRASLTPEQFGKFLPTALVVEYIEQIRGWFQYMLKIGLMAYGKSPFKDIAVHGILFGLDGRKMSKSFGNYKPLSELVNFAAADAFRLWSVSHDPISNRDLSDSEIKDNEKTAGTLHNVSSLLAEYESLANYKPTIGRRISQKGLEDADRWIVSRLETLVTEVTDGLDNYDAATGADAIKRFVIEDFSRFYLKSAKKRMNDPRQIRRAINVIDYVLFRTLIIASPFIPFSTEGVYLGRYKRCESIFLEGWPKAQSKFIDRELESQFQYVGEAVTAILNSREKSNVKLRWPVGTATVEVNNNETETALQRLAAIVEDYTNTKHLEVKRVDSFATEIKPNFAKLGPDFKEKSGAVAEALKGADAKKMMDAIAKSGYYDLHTSKGLVQVKPDHFTSLEKLSKENAVVFKGGMAYIDPKIDSALMEEALIREFERRIQLVRKEMLLKKPDRIEISYAASPELARIIEANRKKIESDVNAKSLRRADVAGAIQFDIDGENVSIQITKL